MIMHGKTVGQAYLLFVPAMCDMVATSLMYIGLTITSASSFQVRCIQCPVMLSILHAVWKILNTSDILLQKTAEGLIFLFRSQIILFFQIAFKDDTLSLWLKRLIYIGEGLVQGC